MLRREGYELYAVVAGHRLGLGSLLRHLNSFQDIDVLHLSLAPSITWMLDS